MGGGNLTERERTAQIIKPILRGRDIKRYSYEWANLWLINTHNGYETTLSSLRGSEATEAIQNQSVDCHESANADSRNDKVKIPQIDIADYPALKKHLDKFYPQLEKRTDKGATPYNLRNCAYVEDFGKEKIVYQQIMAKGANFGFDNQKFFTDTTASIITGANLKYIVALLNSNLVYFVMRNFYMGGGIEGEIKVNNLEKLPIPKINAKNQKIADKIVNVVDKILQSKAQGKDSTTTPYPNATPPCHTTPHPCHTEALAEVSQKPHRDLVDSSLSVKAQNDKRRDRDFSHSTNAQNDKIINELESQIDDLVYQLYDLTHDEIQIIESK